MNRARISRLILACCLALAIAVACTPRERVPLKVQYAGSLIIPFEKLEKTYEASHPGIDLLMEGHGSIQVIRHVTELHQDVDVAITADHALIPLLMHGATVPETGRPYADWYLKFATSKMAIAYRPDSKYASEITADNWYEVLQRPGVRTGLSDPRFDACGYRALMIAQMAEKLYGEPTLFEDWITANFKSPVRTRLDEGELTIRVPEILETNNDGGIVMRGYSIQCIALLMAGEIDYAFAYDAVILQHGLQMLALPDELSLGAQSMAEQYAQVQVELGFQRFASIQPLFRGEPIGYGVIIPTTAQHPNEAAEFVAYLLGPAGQEALAADHQPLLVPAQASHYDAVPEKLRPLCVPLP